MCQAKGTRTRRWTAALVAAVAATAAGAALPRIPADYAFPQGDGSPGVVTFSHQTHVDEKAPSCVGCHPSRFAMLEKGRASGLEAITHQAMEKGMACGACHGKTAFGFDSCENCHR